MKDPRTLHEIKQAEINATAVYYRAMFDTETGRYRTRDPRVQYEQIGSRTLWYLSGEPIDYRALDAMLTAENVNLLPIPEEGTYEIRQARHENKYRLNAWCMYCHLGIPDIHSATRENNRILFGR